MQTFLTVLLAIFVFGMLIFVHELGHYLFARLFKVTINEFSIGMGPRILTWVSKKTNIRYTLAAIPFGGYVSMAGENDSIESDSRAIAEIDDTAGENDPIESNSRAASEITALDDPNSFDKKPAWQRFIITIAGASVNILVGVIVTLIVSASVDFGGTYVVKFADQDKTGYEISSADSGLREGDLIIAVEDKRVFIGDELQYELLRRAYAPVNLTVVRNGEEITLENVVFPTVTEQGQTFGMIDFSINRVEKNFGSVINHAARKSLLTVRQVWESLYDLITGRYTVAAVSGPVGISAAIGDAASHGIFVLLNLIAMISINLGVMNLLPIPALDGFRMFTTLFEMVTRRRIPEKVEAVINAIGLLLLLGLSAVILVKDVFQLFG